MTGSATAPHILLSYLWMSTTNDLFQRKTFKSDSASTGIADESDEDVANADPPSPQSIQDAGSTKRESLLDVWLAARALKPQHLAIGARTPVNRQSVALAYRIANLCAPEMLKLFWTDYPYRALFMISLGLVRGILPVTRGYSHAMIINEVSCIRPATEAPFRANTYSTELCPGSVTDLRGSKRVVAPSTPSRHRGITVQP